MKDSTCGSENQGHRWSTPQIEEVPYVEHEWPLSWFDTAVVTSPHEVDENGAVIIPFPGPTRAEILELRALSNDKRYTQDDRQKFSQIADTMEGAMAERPEPAGNGANEDYVAPGEPANREDISPEFSEDRLALRFVDRYGKDLRHVSAWGKWLVWTNGYWEIENTLLAYHFAREICREAASECNKAGEAKAIARAKTFGAVEIITRSDRRVAATVEQWDCDSWLSNTPGGIVDLRTGNLGPINREKYCTKMTAAAPAKTTDCPVFLRFLNDIAHRDKDYIAYLQRLFGYCLTGDTSEQMLAFAHGPGGGGKTTLFETIGGMMGSYRKVASMDTFVQTLHPQHSTDVASLMGARMVTASETEEGRRWAEAKIKNLTGGDQITARFMRKDPFTYQPQFKLMIFGNHRPSLRSVDEAWRRRFHLLPFTAAIPKEKQVSSVSAYETDWAG